MPIYDYICTGCGHEMEVVHSIHGHGPGACPKCGSKMRKGFSVAAVHFKGSGWARKEQGTRTTKAPKAPGPSSAEPSGGSSSDAGGSASVTTTESD